VIGYTSSPDGDVSGRRGGFPPDIWIVKLTGSGALQWQKCLGGTDFDRDWSIQQTSNGGYVIAGVTLSNDSDVSGNHGNYDGWIVTLDSSGVIEWQKCLGGSLNDMVFSIKQTVDGGYIVSGLSYSNDDDVSGNHDTSGTTSDAWIIKLTSSGVIQWQTCLGGSTNDIAYCIQQTNDSGYVVAGTANSNDGDFPDNRGGFDAWVAKLSNNGSVQWKKCLGGTADDGASSVQQTLDGGYVVAGYTSSNDGDVSGNHDTSVTVKDAWMVKLTGTGTIQWQKCLGGSNDDQANSAHQTLDGEYIMSGLTRSNDGDVSGNHGDYDYWIVKSSACSANFSIYPDSVQLHHYIVINYALGKQPISYDWNWGDGTHDTTPYPTHTYLNAGFYDICLSIRDSNDCVNTFCDSAFNAMRTNNTMVYINVFSPAGLEKINLETPQIIFYPNPLTSSSILRLDARLKGDEIIIYDIFGKEIVRKIVTGDLIVINKESMESGVYLVRIMANERQYLKKIIVQ